VFRSGDARDATFGRAVQMNEHFGALQVLTYGVRLDDIDRRSTCVAVR
jgi:hypothetical protein